MSREPKSVNKKKTHVRVRLSVFFASGERRVCFLLGYVPLFKMSPAEFSIITAAIIQPCRRIIEHNATLENASRQRLVNGVLLHLMQRSRAALSRHIWSTHRHNNSNTNNDSNGLNVQLCRLRGLVVKLRTNRTGWQVGCFDSTRIQPLYSRQPKPTVLDRKKFDQTAPV